MSKNFLLYGFICSLLAICVFNGQIAHADTVIGDNFDNGTLGSQLASPWVNGSGGNSGAYYNADGYNGTIGAIFGNISGGFSNISYLTTGSSTLNLGQYGFFRFKYYEWPATTTQNELIRFTDYHVIGRMGYLEFTDEGYLYFHNNTQNVILKVGMSLNTWYSVIWEYDFTNNRIRFQIDNDAETPWLNFTAGYHGLETIYFSSHEAVGDYTFIIDDLVSQTENITVFEKPTCAQTCAGIDTNTITGAIECGFRCLFVWGFYPSNLSVQTFQTSNENLKDAFPFNAYFDLTDAFIGTMASTSFASSTISMPMIRKHGTSTEFYMLPVLASTSMSNAIGSSNNTLFRNSLIYIVWGAIGLFIIIRLSK